MINEKEPEDVEVSQCLYILIRSNYMHVTRIQDCNIREKIQEGGHIVISKLGPYLRMKYNVLQLQRIFILC